MSAVKPPIPPAEVAAAVARAEGVLKAVRPLLKAKNITWDRVYDLLRMATDELDEPCRLILDWKIERYHREAETEE